LFVLKHRLLSIKETIAIAFVTIATFLLTFAPFIFHHFDSFLQMNPFLVQSTLMPLEYSIFCIILSFGTFFVLKQKKDVYFYSGLILFLTIAFHCGASIEKYNFYETFFNGRADISYFIFCVPFLLYYLIVVDDDYDLTTMAFFKEVIKVGR
jgi:hypothetical protein